MSSRFVRSAKCRPPTRPSNIMSLFTQYKIGTEVKNRGINKRKKDTMYINIIWYINRQLYHSYIIISLLYNRKLTIKDHKLLADVKPIVLRNLLKKGIFIMFREPVAREGSLTYNGRCLATGWVYKRTNRLMLLY